MFLDKFLSVKEIDIYMHKTAWIYSVHSFTYNNIIQKFPLMAMGVLAPVSPHAGPSAQSEVGIEVEKFSRILSLGMVMIWACDTGFGERIACVGGARGEH